MRSILFLSLLSFSTVSFAEYFSAEKVEGGHCKLPDGKVCEAKSITYSPDGCSCETVNAITNKAQVNTKELSKYIGEFVPVVSDEASAAAPVVTPVKKKAETGTANR